jgi:hypothetical protein
MLHFASYFLAQQLVWYVHTVLYLSNYCCCGAGLFESSFLPLSTLGKGGKCGDTPHPVKGLLPLETLLRSTFEKPCAAAASPVMEGKYEI